MAARLRNAKRNAKCKNKKKGKRTVSRPSRSGRSFRRRWCLRPTRATTTDCASPATVATTTEPESDVELPRRHQGPLVRVGTRKRKGRGPDLGPVRGLDRDPDQENRDPDRAQVPESRGQGRARDPESRDRDRGPGPVRGQSRDRGLVRDLPHRNGLDLPVRVDRDRVRPGPGLDHLGRKRDLLQEKEAEVAIQIKVIDKRIFCSIFFFNSSFFSCNLNSSKFFI